MRLITIIGIILTLFRVQATAQTTAMDFNQADCNGVNHHLFAELDAGNVVVISFVMMNCASCITATSALKSIVAGYEASHPGRVKLYSFGYLNNYTCSQMQSWSALGGFTHPVFTGGAAQTAYYGGMGMPTMVVLANNGHDVLFRKLGYAVSDNQNIISAIHEGLLYVPSAVEENGAQKPFMLAYLEAESGIRVGFPKPETGKISVYDLTGREIRQVGFQQSTQVSTGLENLPEGIYLVAVTGRSGKLGTEKVLVR